MAVASVTKCLAVNTVYFWPDPHQCLGEIARVLTAEGVLAARPTPVENLGAAIMGWRELLPPDTKARQRAH